MNRRFAWLVLVVVILIAVFLAWRGSSEREPLAPEPSTTQGHASKQAELDSPAEPRASRTSEVIEPAPETAPLAPTPQPAAESSISMHVRIVDRSSDAPVVGAVVERSRREGESVASDVDGRCSFNCALSVIRMPQFSQGTGLVQGFCRVRADGFGLAEFREEEGHESADKALEVKLDKGATLAVALLHRPESDAGAYEVRASVQASDLTQNNPETVSIDTETLHFKSACDGVGNVVLDSLPASVPITLAVFQGDKLVHAVADTLKLEPGARRDVEIDLGAGCRLRVRVLDADSTRVAKADVWLVRSGQYPKPEFGSWDKKDLVGSAISDSSGELVLKDVSAGEYWLGLAPLTIEQRVKADKPDPKAYTAVNIPVAIEEGETAKDVELRVETGLYISGTVMNFDGTPATGGQVFVAEIPSGANSHRAMAFTRKDGTFTSGPLLRRRYALQAGGGWGQSLQVEADAGATDVVLTTRAPSDVTLRVVEVAGGPGVKSDLMIAYLDGSRMMKNPIGDTGSISLRSLPLPPGRISVVATTADGRIGVVPSIELVAGGAPEIVEVLLSPGAKLRVKTAAEAQIQRVEVLQQGALMDYPRVGSPDAPAVMVPTGEVTIRFKLSGNPPVEREQTVTLIAGEDREVVLEP